MALIGKRAVAVFSTLLFLNGVFHTATTESAPAASTHVHTDASAPPTNAQPLPKVEHFDFRPYVSNPDALKRFGFEHFPVGTPRTYIENILVNQGHAIARRANGQPAPGLYSIVYGYHFGDKEDCSVGVEFAFDEHDETVYIANSWEAFILEYSPLRIISGCNNPALAFASASPAAPNVQQAEPPRSTEPIPVNPLPKVKHFDFHAFYDNFEDFKNFADTHFPIGTPRAYIEDILVKQGHATARRQEHLSTPKLYSMVYAYRFGDKENCSVGVEFAFNKHDETAYIATAGANLTIHYLPFRNIGGCDGL